MRTKFFISLLTMLIYTGCKKKEKDPEPAPQPVAPVVQTNKMTAKVDNNPWVLYYDGLVDGIVTSKSGGNYGFGGQTNLSNPYTSISIGFKPAIGTFTLSEWGNYYARYYDANGTSFKSKTGTLTITEFDTACFILCKLRCTFNFQTDTINSVSHSITEGKIEYK